MQREVLTPSERPSRSALFVPADRPERFDKAWLSGADDVILDLEDAVGLEHKDAARANVEKWLSADRRAWVRINAHDTPWHSRDLELLRCPWLIGVVLPKAEHLSARVVHTCTTLGKRLIPLIETAVGFQTAAVVAGTPGVERLAFGHLDFQLDLGIVGDDDALLYFRSQLVLLSRIAGIRAPLDGVTVQVANPPMLETETLRAKRLGFGGKLCIHPRQVETINRVFSPTEQELAWARAVLNAVEASQGAAVA
jgi:citrate lyase subunit beta / citryl-CoA lyase